MKHRYARVHNGVVTHMVQTQPQWIDLNPWPDVPGIWIECAESVSTEWQYDSATKVFLPPVNK